MPIILAAALVLGATLYVLVRWHRAPAAFRAISAVASVCFVAGLLAGFWSARFGLPALASRGLGGVVPFAPVGDSVPASDVGKAIVENDEKHAGEALSVPSSQWADLCNRGFMDSKDLTCRVAYLARHAEGKDLDHGSHDAAVSLSEVADICDSGAIDKAASLCTAAYAARRAKMK